MISTIGLPVRCRHCMPHARVLTQQQSTQFHFNPTQHIALRLITGRDLLAFHIPHRPPPFLVPTGQQYEKGEPDLKQVSRWSAKLFGQKITTRSLCGIHADMTNGAGGHCCFVLAVSALRHVLLLLSVTAVRLLCILCAMLTLMQTSPPYCTGARMVRPTAIQSNGVPPFESLYFVHPQAG